MSDGKVRGVVHFIDQTKTFGQKGFRKRMVVLEQDKGRFVNYLPLEFMQDGCSSVDQLSIGDEVEIEYRLSGRKWQKDAQSEIKYFLTAEALAFTKLAAADRPADADDINSQLAEADSPDDDVPF
jgi:hypothetical protein